MHRRDRVHATACGRSPTYDPTWGRPDPGRSAKGQPGSARGRIGVRSVDFRDRRSRRRCRSRRRGGRGGSRVVILLDASRSLPEREGAAALAACASRRPLREGADAGGGGGLDPPRRAGPRRGRAALTTPCRRDRPAPILACRGGLVEPCDVVELRAEEGFRGGRCAEVGGRLAKAQAFSRNLRTCDSIALPGTRNGLSVMSTEKLCAEMA